MKAENVCNVSDECFREYEEKVFHICVCYPLILKEQIRLQNEQEQRIKRH